MVFKVMRLDENNIYSKVINVNLQTEKLLNEKKKRTKQKD